MEKGLAAGWAVGGTAELWDLVCAREAQQQASQEEQAGERRNGKCVRGGHGATIAANETQGKPAGANACIRGFARARADSIRK
jgi:hypothetical protein